MLSFFFLEVLTTAANQNTNNSNNNNNNINNNNNNDEVNPTSEKSFLVRNDIKLFQSESNCKENNNNNNRFMIVDRRRSDTDALHDMSDVRLVRQKLLKYAHVESQDSTDSDTTPVESCHVNGKMSGVTKPTFTTTIHVSKHDSQN